MKKLSAALICSFFGVIMWFGGKAFASAAVNHLGFNSKHSPVLTFAAKPKCFECTPGICC